MELPQVPRQRTGAAALVPTGICNNENDKAPNEELPGDKRTHFIIPTLADFSCSLWKAESVKLASILERHALHLRKPDRATDSTNRKQGKPAGIP
jgi:hypothetical protein